MDTKIEYRFARSRLPWLVAVGAVVASLRMRLEDGPRVITLGIGMGILIILLIFITNVWVAAPFLILLGALGGFLVVPMNACCNIAVTT